MNRRQHRPHASALLLSSLALTLLLHSCGKPAPVKSGASAKSAKASEPAKKSAEQAPKPRAPETSSQDRLAGMLIYPRDMNRLMATVQGRKVVLEDIVEHIEMRHYEGFRFLISSPGGRRELQIPRMANWTSQYASILILEAEARRLGIKTTEIRKNQGEVYLRAFEQFQLSYQEHNRKPFPSTKTGYEFLRKAFQKDRGLGLELEGLLNTMVPDKLDKRGVVAFYKRNSEAMNGYLNISQIFVNTRDRHTGALFVGDRMKKAQQKIREISKLLNKNGKNFELIASAHSEDEVSAKLGGVLHNLHRFDPRMPAKFCRTAWSIRNDQWKGPFDTLFGTHFVKRIEWLNTKMIVNPDPDNQDIRHFVRSHRKEALIFKLRKSSSLQLHY